MIAVRRDHVSSAPLWLQVVLAHETAQLLPVHDETLVAQRRPDPPIAVAFELVTDRADGADELVLTERNGGLVVEGRAREAHQLAPSLDGDGVGPVTTEVVALLGRGACFKAPFSSSISSAWRPTIRSRAAILASYS